MHTWVEIRQRNEKQWAGLQAGLLAILDEALLADAAAKGNIQLYNADRGGLQIVAQRGFSLPFLHHFELVRPDESSACSRALRGQQRVLIPDIDADPAFAPHRSIAQASGFAAVQSTPIFRQDGVLVGVLSTHFSRPHYVSAVAQVALDVCAARIASLAAHLV